MDTRQPEILVLLSGGIDSFACADFFMSMGRSLCTLHVDYGQAAALPERRAADRVAEFLDVAIAHLRLVPATPKLSGEIPSRNAFLISVAAMERPSSVTAIALGIHAGTTYPDCSSDFVERSNALLQVTKPSVQVVAPFLDWQKSDILEYCDRRHLPFGLTHSCER